MIPHTCNGVGFVSGVSVDWEMAMFCWDVGLWAVWLVVGVISRDPVMLLSLLKLSVVWVWGQYVCPTGMHCQYQFLLFFSLENTQDLKRI